MLIAFVTSIETMDSLHSPESSILALTSLLLHDHKPFVLYIITGCHVPSCTASAPDKRPVWKRDTYCGHHFQVMPTYAYVYCSYKER